MYSVTELGLPSPMVEKSSPPHFGQHRCYGPRCLMALQAGYVMPIAATVEFAA